MRSIRPRIFELLREPFDQVIIMNPHRTRLAREEGFTLVYMAATLTVLLLATGLAVDGGRSYVVKAQLSKAVDGAALAAARSLNTGSPRAEAVRVFQQNFPTGWFGTTRRRSQRGVRILHFNGGRTQWREHRHRDGHHHAADDVHEAGKFQSGHRLGPVRQPGAWWICRWSSTCPARSGRRGRRFATRRAPSSTHSTPTATAWR